MVLTQLDRYRDVGLLVIRAGVGLAFTLLHGVPKMRQGPEGWKALAELADISLLPTFFGFMGAFSEFAGGLLLAAGLLFRPTLFFLICTMVVAVYANVLQGNNFTHALEIGIVFAGLFLTGPGRYSLDARFTKPKG